MEINGEAVPFNSSVTALGGMAVQYGSKTCGAAAKKVGTLVGKGDKGMFNEHDIDLMLPCPQDPALTTAACHRSALPPT